MEIVSKIGHGIVWCVEMTARIVEGAWNFLASSGEHIGWWF